MGNFDTPDDETPKPARGKFDVDDDAPPPHEFPEGALAKPPEKKKPNGEGHENTRPALDWITLSQREPPERHWAIRGWFGFGHTTLLVGHGGIGKTLIAQQIASCLAVGRQFIDEIENPYRVLMWACEDDHDELWRRQIAISHWMRMGIDEYAGNLQIIPRHGLDNALCAMNYGKLAYTPTIALLEEQARDTHAQIVILDNAAQLYGGPENDRHCVTAFLNALAGALPGMGVMLLAHPSRGLNSEFSGSSAWENVARTRLYLGATLPGEAKPAEDEENIRYLARRKANYANTRDWKRCQYRDGVLIPEEATGGILDSIRDANCEKAILAAIPVLHEKQQFPTDTAQSGPRYLPRMVKDFKLAEGFTEAVIASAMRRMLMDGRIVKGTVSRGQDRHPIQGLRLPDL